MGARDSAPIDTNWNLSNEMRSSTPDYLKCRRNFIKYAISLMTQQYITRLGIAEDSEIVTRVARAIVKDSLVTARFGSDLFFISCEKLAGVSFYYALARELGVSVEGDALASIANHLMRNRPTLLVLDHLDEVWETPAVSWDKVNEVNGLLSRLANIPSLSLIVTCKKFENIWSVEWSNSGNMDPDSYEA